MRFQPKVRHQDTMLFYLVFGALFLIGVASLIFNDASFRFLPGWGIIGFSGFLFFILWQQNAATDMRYELLEEGIFLKRFFFKKTIPYRQIQKIEILNSKEAAAVIEVKQGEEVIHYNSLSFKAFDVRKELNEIIKYSSVPVTFSSTTSGIKVISHSVIVKGDFILLQTLEGQKYLITPEKMREFVDAVLQKMKA